MKRNAPVLLSFILLFMFCGRAYGAISPGERAALIALYNSTGGDNWTNNSGWKTTPLDADGFAGAGSEDSWFGITVSGSHVLEIKLDNNQLNGSIPMELGNLTELEELYLHHNQLTGTIPSQLGDLLKLEILHLCCNQLDGGIPASLGNLSELEELHLYSNLLSGSIPPELGNLSTLGTLYLYSNQLTGSIPPELGNLLKLSDLRLNHNQLTGSIPMELGALSKLGNLFCHSNQLSGMIPQQLDSLSNLEELNLGSNKLEGEIPFTSKDFPDLVDNRSDFRWNALYSNDETLKNFLASKQIGGDWESTQTIAPKGVTARATSATSIEIKWRPIVYTGDSGGYRVFYSTAPGPPYTFFNTTTSKTAAQLEVTGFSPGTYYFVVRTRTDPHGNNGNTVDSEYSAEVFESTSGDSVRISGRVATEAGVGEVGVTLEFSKNGMVEGTALTDASGNYSFAVPNGWTGKVTPSKVGVTFKPAFISYEEPVTADKPMRDYTSFSSTIPISGRITIARDSGIEGLPGVKLTFSKINGSEEPVTVETNANGTYSHEVTPGWSGTVEPSSTEYNFSPSEQKYNNLQSPMLYQNYTATDSLVGKLVISGSVTIRNSNGTPEGLGGVTITFSGQNGSGSSTITTNDRGYYSYAVEPGWSGTVIPTKDGHYFSPPRNSYKNVLENRLCENFRAFTGELDLILVASGKVDDTLFITEYYVELTRTIVKQENVEVKEYKLSRKVDDGNYELIETDPQFPYIDRGLDKDKKYTYKITAFNMEDEPIAEAESEPITQWER
ncbi:MAG: hypothetical protein GY940_12475 [bacterium]|nr:hypothetical protein [bacterium]